MRICRNILWVLIPLIAASTVHCQMNFRRNERAALAVYYRHQLELLGNYTVTSVHEIFAVILNDSDTVSHLLDDDFRGPLQMLRDFNAKAGKIHAQTALYEIDLDSLVNEFIEIHMSISNSSTVVRKFFDRKFEEHGMRKRYDMFMQRYRQFFVDFVYIKLANYLDGAGPREETSVRQWRDSLMAETDELKRLELFGKFMDVFTGY